MGTAQIRIDQPTHPTSPVGVAGRSRDDIVQSQPVQLRNVDDTGVRSWRWTILDQPRTATPDTLSSTTGPIVTFTPSNTGTYRIRLTVDEGRKGQVQILLVAVRDENNRRNPAAGEQSEANWIDSLTGQPNDRGWATDMEIIAGGADVSGPVSSTDNAVALFSGTAGDALKNSLVIVAANGTITTPGNLVVGDGTGLPTMTLDSDPASESYLGFTEGGVDMWRLNKRQGNDFAIRRYLAGAFDGTALSISNADGDVTLEKDLALPASGAVVTLGDGTGAPNLRLNKGGADEGRIEWQNGGTWDWRLYQTGSEDLAIQRNGAVGVVASFDESNGDLTLTKDVIMNRAAAAFLLGDGTDSPSVRIDKGDTSNNDAIQFRNAGNVRWAWHHRSDESFRLSRHDAAGVFLNWPILVDTFGSIALEGNLSMNAAAPVFTVGSGGGSPTVNLNKSDADETLVRFQNAGSVQWAIQLATDEHLNIQRYSGGVFQENQIEFLDTGGMIFGGFVDLRGNFVYAQRYDDLATPTISSTQNNYDPASFGTAHTIRITLSGGDQTITGIAAPGAGDNEEVVFVCEATTGVLTFGHQNAGSTTNNRIIGVGQRDTQLQYGDAATLRYDWTQNRWVIIGLARAGELMHRTVSATGTLVKGSYYRATNTAAISLTLPAPGDVGARIHVEYDSDIAGRNIDWVENTANDFDFDESRMRLRIPREYVEFIDDGLKWQVYRDGRIPHVCVLDPGTVQNINNNTETQLTTGSSLTDNGLLRSGSDIVIGRNGAYRVFARAACDLDDQDSLTLRTGDSVGATHDDEDHRYGSGASAVVNTARTDTIGTWDAADVMRCWATQVTGAAADISERKWGVVELLNERESGLD